MTASGGLPDDTQLRVVSQYRGAGDIYSWDTNCVTAKNLGEHSKV